MKRTPTPRIRRQRTRRSGLILGSTLATAALLLSACGASSDSDSAAANATDPGPGITESTVKIGFVAPNKATSAGGGGFVVADQGDAKAQIDAIVEHVNANGGFGGRQIEPVIRSFESSSDSPQTESALCNAFTRDDEVFAVVLVAQRLPVARECYRKADTVMIDIGGHAITDQDYAENKPHFWSLTTPSFDASLRAMVPNLAERGFFGDDAVVGVLMEKGDQYQRLVDDVLTPALTEAGQELAVVAEIDQTTPDSAGTTSRTAVTKLKDAGVTHLLFAGRPDNVGYYTGTAHPQKFYPRLALSSFEDPNFLASNPAFSPPRTLEGAMGIGMSPSSDGVRETYDFPETDAQKSCVEDVYRPKDIEFESVAHARNAMRYCDSATLLQAVGEKLGSDTVVNATTFADAAYSLGDSWQAAYMLRTHLAEGVHAPNDGYRSLAYEDGKFVYSGDLMSLSGQ